MKWNENSPLCTDVEFQFFPEPAFHIPVSNCKSFNNQRRIKSQLVTENCLQICHLTINIASLVMISACKHGCSPLLSLNSSRLIDSCNICVEDILKIERKYFPICKVYIGAKVICQSPLRARHRRYHTSLWLVNLTPFWPLIGWQSDIIIRGSDPPDHLTGSLILTRDPNISDPNIKIEIEVTTRWVRGRLRLPAPALITDLTLITEIKHETTLLLLLCPACLQERQEVGSKFRVETVKCPKCCRLLLPPPAILSVLKYFPTKKLMTQCHYSPAIISKW